MDRSSDREVLQVAVDWLDNGSPITLVTVAKTWGSSPRRPGSLMVIHPDGRFVGSVSGGCVEDDLVERALHGEFSAAPKLETYGIQAEQAQRVGLPCGGSLQLLIEHIDTPEQQLSRLHGPVGLSIGSRTPAEIAIAIADHLILERQTQPRSFPQTAYA